MIDTILVVACNSIAHRTGSNRIAGLGIDMPAYTVNLDDFGIWMERSFHPRVDAQDVKTLQYEAWGRLGMKVGPRENVPMPVVPGIEQWGRMLLRADLDPAHYVVFDFSYTVAPEPNEFIKITRPFIR